MMAYTLIIVGILLLVVVHELGHLWAARATGIRATRFMVGFPPIVWSTRRGDTEYGIGATMLGGYVKLPGMFEPRADELAERLAGPLAALGEEVPEEDASELAALLAAIAACRDTGLLERRLRDLLALLERVTPGVLPDRSRRRLLRAVGDMVEDCHPQAYWRAALWRRMVVILAGPAANVLVAVALLMVLALWFTPRFTATWYVSEVVPGSPAAEAGIVEGDRIASWNGTPAVDLEFAELVQAGLGDAVTIGLDGSGGQREAVVTPVEIDGMQRIGIAFVPEDVVRDGTYRRTVSEAASSTADITRRLTTGMLTGLARVVYRPESREDVRTIVGIVQEAPEVQEAGRLWHYLAFISLALAVFNMLPLLPLDGGHVAFGVVEAARRGRSLPRAAFEQASIIGLGLILVLFLVGLQNDLRG